MSHTAHIPSHRKPRRGASKTAIRSGVAGGVLSTIALAGAAAPANAEPVTETIEMPTLTAGLAGSVAQSAAATQQVADSLDLRAQEDAAATHAAKVAKKAKAEAQRKAEAKEKAAAAARAKAAEERASRSEERTTLAASSGSSAPASNASTQATGSAAAVLAFARAQVGDAYVLGSTGPNSWDCSSLVQAAYRQAGIDLPRTSQPQSTAGTQVSLDNLQVGDILYWGGAGSAYHVGIYSGGGKFIGAQNSGTGVVEKTLDWDPPSGAVRLL
ncbi:C40 family peptidase [Streptomyces niveus]|uniref:C40 family peptidase n=1 Tax=Streptomyces niveus TaxID=193462 RepID=A0ABZ2A485_STRNV|nr:C40 family peptidase [Streptomyces niveus]WTA61091.1 C40 family peptidase [Streptomyces niveus]